MTVARLKGAIGAAECVGVASSIHYRPPEPAIQFLPGTNLAWVLIFLAGAIALMYAATSGYPQAIVLTFGVAATIHGSLCVGLVGVAITAATGWLGASFTGLIAVVYALEAVRIARLLP